MDATENATIASIAHPAHPMRVRPWHDATAAANKAFTENIPAFLTASSAQGKLARVAAVAAKESWRASPPLQRRKAPDGFDRLDLTRAKCFDR
jgi:hypothetical protein